MKKEEFLNKVLLPQLERLKVVEKLAEEGKVHEIEDIQKDIEYRKVEDYFFSDEFEGIDTRKIPNENLIELVVWINGAENFDEGDLFTNLDDFLSRLYNLGGAGAVMAKLPEMFAYYTVEELFTGEKE